jgi:hypothetical protein
MHITVSGASEHSEALTVSCLGRNQPFGIPENCSHNFSSKDMVLASFFFVDEE